MNETMLREKVHQAVDNHCAHLKEDYWLAQRVMAMAAEPETSQHVVQRRRKLPVALVVLIALMLMSVTAVAAVVLSAKQVVEQELIPMAQQNDAEETVEPEFSNEELRRIVEIAEENGIELPKYLLDRIDVGLGYWEEETIMMFAREAFGGLYIDWTIEQKHWFGEVMVDIGFWEHNWDCVPGNGEISLDEAVAVAANAAKAYGDDLYDASRWRFKQQYSCGLDEETQQITAPVWYLTFNPTSVRDNGYMFTISAKGEVLETIVHEALDDAKEMWGLDVYFQYERVYGSQTKWTPEVWVALHDDLQGRLYNGDSWLYAYLDFILPPEGGLTQAAAEALALKTVNAEHMEVYISTCCMAIDTPVWKVEVRTYEPDGSPRSIWWLEIDCMTGEIRDMIEVESLIGPDAPPRMWRFMPKNVYEDWLTIENG